MWRYDQHQRDKAYRVYITDTLYYQSQNKHLTQRYIDVITPKKIDTRSADEIAADIIKRAGLTLKKKGGDMK